MSQSWTFIETPSCTGNPAVLPPALSPEFLPDPVTVRQACFACSSTFTAVHPKPVNGTSWPETLLERQWVGLSAVESCHMMSIRLKHSRLGLSQLVPSPSPGPPQISQNPPHSNRPMWWRAHISVVCAKLLLLNNAVVIIDDDIGGPDALSIFAQLDRSG